MGRLLRRLRYWFRQREHDAALQEEIEFHRALKQQELEAGGLSSDAARWASRRDLGNVTRAREDSRAVWLWPWLESVAQDLRLAMRALLAAPSFTIPALAVLVITMGLTTSVYAIVDALLLRPWRVPDADRVVLLDTTRTLGRARIFSANYLEYTYLREARSVALAAYVPDQRRLDGATDAVDVRFASGDYFDVLRIPVVAGRPLYASDDVRDAPPTMVISKGLAERTFGGPASAIGRVVRIRDVAFTIVGVAAPGARDLPLAPPPEAWLPLNSAWNLTHSPSFGDALSMERFFTDPSQCCVRIVGRLAAGTTREVAQAEAAILSDQFAAAHGAARAEISLRGTAGIDNPRETQTIAIAALFSVAVTLVLLLGCANVGNLVIARAAARRLDSNVRLALGATRMRLVRHLLAESVTLSLAAAFASLLIARVLLPAFMSRLGFPFDQLAVPMDTRTIAIVFALAVAVTLTSGTLPALRATRLAAGGRAVGRAPSRLRSTLLGAQVAISLVLLVGAGLLARGLFHAAGSGLGFSLDQVNAVRLRVPFKAYTAPEFDRLAATIHAEAHNAGMTVAGTEFAPFTVYRMTRNIRVPPGKGARVPFAVRHQVTPEYFDLLDISVLAGRIFGAASRAGDVVVNETLAQRLWPGQPAVGRVFIDAERPEDQREKRVVAVVGDARSQEFDSAHATYYERAVGFSYFLFRGDAADTARLSAVIRRVVPDATVSVIDMAGNLRGQMQPALIGAAAAAAVALLALLLAAVGTLGVFSYLVTEQIPEIGVRKALGASSGDIVRMLLRGVARPMVAGLVVGVLGAQALGIVLGGNLYGISPRDPIAYAAVFVVLLAAACLALIGPARRAVRVDPASMLRAE
jgi:predicted permease